MDGRTAGGRTGGWLTDGWVDGRRMDGWRTDGGACGGRLRGAGISLVRRVKVNSYDHPGEFVAIQRCMGSYPRWTDSYGWMDGRALGDSLSAPQGAPSVLSYAFFEPYGSWTPDVIPRFPDGQMDREIDRWTDGWMAIQRWMDSYPTMDG